MTKNLGTLPRLAQGLDELWLLEERSGRHAARLELGLDVADLHRAEIRQAPARLVVVVSS